MVTRRLAMKRDWCSTLLVNTPSLFIATIIVSFHYYYSRHCSVSFHCYSSRHQSISFHCYSSRHCFSVFSLLLFSSPLSVLW